MQFLSKLAFLAALFCQISIPFWQKSSFWTVCQPTNLHRKENVPFSSQTNRFVSVPFSGTKTLLCRVSRELRVSNLSLCSVHERHCGSHENVLSLASFFS